MRINRISSPGKTSTKLRRASQIKVNVFFIFVSLKKGTGLFRLFSSLPSIKVNVDLKKDFVGMSID